jgi:hypothetical protein
MHMAYNPSSGPNRRSMSRQWPPQPSPPSAHISPEVPPPLAPPVPILPCSFPGDVGHLLGAALPPMPFAPLLGGDLPRGSLHAWRVLEGVHPRLLAIQLGLGLEGVHPRLLALQLGLGLEGVHPRLLAPDLSPASALPPQWRRTRTTGSGVVAWTGGSAEEDLASACGVETRVLGLVGRVAAWQRRVVAWVVTHHLLPGTHALGALPAYPIVWDVAQAM